MELILEQNGARKAVPAAAGETILQALQRAGVTSVHSPCGGAGTCKKCTVTVRGGGMDGECLACQTIVAEGMTVVLDDHGEMEVQQSGACAVYPPDEGQSGYAVSCDIGPTTVVCHLLNCATCARIGTVGGANAQ